MTPRPLNSSALSKPETWPADPPEPWYCAGCNGEYEQGEECECPRDKYEALGIDTYEDLAAYRLGEE